MRIFSIIAGGAIAAAIYFDGADAAARSGHYRLAVGNGAFCSITLADDGHVSADPACKHVDDFAKWRATPSGLEFTDNGGTAVAELRTTSEGYAGKTIGEYHQLILLR